MAQDDEPRWRDWDEEDDEPREWEIEPEEEKEDEHHVLGGTAPLAKVVFFAIVLAFVIAALVAFVRALSHHFGGA